MCVPTTFIPRVAHENLVVFCLSSKFDIFNMPSGAKERPNRHYPSGVFLTCYRRETTFASGGCIALVRGSSPSVGPACCAKLVYSVRAIEPVVRSVWGVLGACDLDNRCTLMVD